MSQAPSGAATQLVESIRTLAIAWRNMSAYPPGHPARNAALENAHRRIADALGPVGKVILGVAPDALAFGEGRIESPQAVKLAQALYRRNVALLTLEEGIEPAELEAFLQVLADESHLDATPVWDALASAGVRHIQLQPVDYSAVSVDEDLEIQKPKDKESLWDAILRVLMAGGHLSIGGRDVLAPESLSAGGIAGLIERALQASIGSGAGWGAGTEAGEGSGEGSGEGAGRGSGEGDGEGAGRGSGEGSGEGSGRGSGEGSGEGSGRGSGQGSGEGSGQGDGPGPDVGSGRGSGGGLGTGARAAGRGLGGPAGVAATVGDAVSGYLARARGGERQVTAQQITELVRSLPVEVRETVVVAALKQLAADEGDGEAFATLAASVSPDAVLKILRRLHGEGAKLSKHVLKLAESLAPPPPPPDPESAPSEEEVTALLGDVRALYGEEDIDRLNVEDQKALFDRVVVDVELMAARDMPAGALGTRLDSLTDEALAERVAWTLLEVLRRGLEPDGIDGVLARLAELFGSFVASDRLEPAVAVVEGIREALERPDLEAPVRDALAAVLSQMANRDSTLTLLESLHRLGEERAALARRLIELLGAAAARNCLLALSDETNRSRRRRLFDFLAALGPVIVGPASELLADERWFVVRNMIVLLRAVGDRASLPEIERCARHPDLRVRLEAIKTLFAFGAEVPEELLAEAIHDPDPKLAETAITLVGQYGIGQAAEPLLDVVAGLDLFGRRRSLRLKALEALGKLANPEVLPHLARFLRDYRLLPLVSAEERRAAYRSLEFYDADVRRPHVDKGLRSRDPEIRQVCERLARSVAVPAPTEEEAEP